MIFKKNYNNFFQMRNIGRWRAGANRAVFVVQGTHFQYFAGIFSSWISLRKNKGVFWVQGCCSATLRDGMTKNVSCLLSVTVSDVFSG
jgi:hypothetical protein